MFARLTRKAVPWESVTIFQPFALYKTFAEGALLHVGVPCHLDGSITEDQIVGAMMNSLPRAR